MDSMKDFLLAFIPVFVAVDAIGVLPIFITLTQGLDKRDRSKVIFHSMVTALGLAVFFIFLGMRLLDEKTSKDPGPDDQAFITPGRGLTAKPDKCEVAKVI